jgi:hypothetical protein
MQPSTGKKKYLSDVCPDCGNYYIYVLRKFVDKASEQKKKGYKQHCKINHQNEQEG